MPIPATPPVHGATIECYFTRKWFLARAERCILAPLWTDFIGTLRRWGYSECGIFTTLRHSFRFAEFAVEQGASDPSGLTDALAARHSRSGEPRPGKAREVRVCLNRLMAFLRDRGVLSPVPATPAVQGPPILEEYATFLAQHRSARARSIQGHRHHILALLGAVAGQGKALADLNAQGVFDFVTKHAIGLTRSRRKVMCAALRSFLRFLFMKGYVRASLAESVPVIPSFKLDRLPRCIDPADVDAILRIVDRTNPVGRRDYAMLLVLGTYGLRAGQLCALQLDDIDWRRETIRVPAAKNGRAVVLPLLPAVGEAIVDYLRHGRATSSFRELFLRVRPPLGPLGAHLTGMIRPYARRAGLKSVPTGPHAWRHGCASRMLAGGESLKTIRDILGHRSIETTFIYTKVDIGMLRQAALEWPGVR